jgi:hypothetical protein
MIITLGKYAVHAFPTLFLAELLGMCLHNSTTSQDHNQQCCDKHHWSLPKRFLHCIIHHFGAKIHKYSNNQFFSSQIFTEGHVFVKKVVYLQHETNNYWNAGTEERIKPI